MTITEHNEGSTMYYTKDTYRDVEFFNIEPDIYGNPRVVVWY